MPLNDYQKTRLSLIPRVFLVGAWCVGGIWGISYFQPPPMPAPIGIVAAAVAVISLALMCLVGVLRPTANSLRSLIAITLAANIVFPLVAHLMKAK